MLSASVLRARDELTGSWLLSSGGAGRVWEVEAVGRCSGRVEEGRSGKQSTRDDADALSLVRLLSAPVLRVRDKPPSSSLL